MAEAEDSAGRHYYFFLDGGARIDRVRWVRNGGCCNRPEVTDYNLHVPRQSGAIQVRHLTGERQDILQLATGEDAALTLEREYVVTLPVRGPDPVKPTVALDRQQSSDLYNLVAILARERPERPPEGCQSMEREMEP
ncbi:MULTISPECIES: hypothetical protein [unclassified Luteimonas]